jgi:hypothetical protein
MWPWDLDGTATDLLQLKHHVGAAGALGDRDSDWWRTIRAWMDSGEPGDPDGPTLNMVTTQRAREGTAAHYLRPVGRDPVSAVRLLEDAARTSREKKFAATRASFLKLPDADREIFVSRMFVLDGSPLIEDLDPQVRHLLRWSLPIGHEDVFMGQVWGWWDAQAIAMLRKSRSGMSALELRTALSDFRDGFVRENLPTLIELADVDESAVAEQYREMPFVHQMRLVDAPPLHLQKAIVDYYRAVVQQQRWVDDDLIGMHEVERFELNLLDEWQREFEWMVAEMAGADEQARRQAGRELLRACLNQTRHLIRERYREPFFARGKHHELADQLKVGWHPEFRERLENLLAGRGAA